MSKSLACPLGKSVAKEEEYLYSSCCDHYGTRKGLLELSENI